MRGISKITAGLTIATLLLSFVAFIGCSDLPSKPQGNYDALSEFECLIANPGLDVLNNLGNDNTGQATEQINARTGGTISVPMEAATAMQFSVPPRSLDKDVTIDIHVEKHESRLGITGLFFEFGPDGLVFKRPAILTVYADDYGNPSAEWIAWYYYNPDTGRLELQDVYKFRHGVARIKVYHFSRYLGISQGGQ